MNIAGLEHGARLLWPVLWCKPALDSLLAIPEDFAIGSVHSKWPFCRLFCLLSQTHFNQYLRAFRAFSVEPDQKTTLG
jgi:hypothetical protein